MRGVDLRSWGTVPMYLDVTEVAKLLHVPENQVYRWINENHLPAIEVARQVLLQPVRLAGMGHGPQDRHLA